MFYFLVLAGVIANDFWQLGVVGRCYCHVAFGFATYVSVFFLAGVIASCFVFFVADGDAVSICLMFVLAEVIAFCFCGCWYCHFDHQLYQKVYHSCYFLMADVIARMADGIAMYMIGSCYCHMAGVFTTDYFLFCWQIYCLVADVSATIM